MRVDGAIAAVVGLGVMLTGGVVPLALFELGAPQEVAEAFLAVLLVGWGLFVIGGYRVVTGRHPESERYTYGASLARVFIGVGLVVGAFAVLMGSTLLALHLLGVK
jgi:hypothetical protein